VSRTRRLSRYGWSTRSLSIRYVKRKTFNPSRCVFNAPILQLSDWWPSSNLYYAPDCACGERYVYRPSSVLTRVSTKPVQVEVRDVVST